MKELEENGGLNLTCFKGFSSDGAAVMIGKITGVLTRLKGWSGGAMVLGKLLVPGRPTIWIVVGQGPTALAVGAGGGCLDIFTLIYPFFPLSPSLWETARYRLKYCLKGPLNPKPTNQPTKLTRLKQVNPVLLMYIAFATGLPLPSQIQMNPWIT